MDKSEIEIEFSGIKIKLPRNSAVLNPPTRWHFNSEELTHRILRKHKISYHYFDELKNELEKVADKIFEEDCGGDDLLDNLDLEELSSMLKFGSNDLVLKNVYSFNFFQILTLTREWIKFLSIMSKMKKRKFSALQNMN